MVRAVGGRVVATEDACQLQLLCCTERGASGWSARVTGQACLLL